MAACRAAASSGGRDARAWARAGIRHNALAYSTEIIEVWFARGLTAGPSQLEQGELLDIRLVPEDELDAAAGRGELTDAKSALTLIHAARRLGKLK